MAWGKIDQSRVRMRAINTAKAWNNLMEELDQVVMESNHTYCEEIHNKLKGLADELRESLRKAYDG